MTILDVIRHRLKKAGTAPNAIRGQHFLADTDALSAIADNAAITGGDVVLEIGPGVGNLTDELLARGALVVAVEKDPKLAHFLRQHYGERIDVRAQDILSFDETGMPEDYIVVGNIPYYITGKIVRKFLESESQPKRIVLTVQKEVGERIAAAPPKATFLSVLTQLMADVEIGPIIPPHHFWPAPKVDSIVVVLTPHASVEDIDKNFISFVRQGFHQPRKTLLNNLLQLEGVKKESVLQILSAFEKSEKTRAHELSLDEWRKLFSLIRKD